MSARPTATELMDAIAELLEGPLFETSQGGLRHQVRVAANLSRILERELALAPGQRDRAAKCLASLLGRDSAEDPALTRRALFDALLAGNPELESRAWPVLVELTRDQLAIDKPGHDDYDFDAELP